MGHARLFPAFGMMGEWLAYLDYRILFAHSLKNGHTLLNGSARIARVVRGVDTRQEGYIHAERLGGHRPRFLYGVPKSGRVGLSECGDDSCRRG